MLNVRKSESAEKKLQTEFEKSKRLEESLKGAKQDQDAIIAQEEKQYQKRLKTAGEALKQQEKKTNSLENQLKTLQSEESAKKAEIEENYRKLSEKDMINMKFY